MAWHLTSDIAEFEDAAGEFLRAEPVRNTVLLTVVASLKASGATAYGDAPPSFGWYEDSEVSAAFLRTPPMPAIVTDAPRHAARSLVEALDGVPGLSGPADAVRAFADAWQAAAGSQPTVDSRTRLFRLAELVPPKPAPPGRARLVTDADRHLLLEWFSAFSANIGEPVADAARSVDRRLANGELGAQENDLDVRVERVRAVEQRARARRVLSRETAVGIDDRVRHVRVVRLADAEEEPGTSGQGKDDGNCANDLHA